MVVVVRGTWVVVVVLLTVVVVGLTVVDVAGTVLDVVVTGAAVVVVSATVVDATDWSAGAFTPSVRPPAAATTRSPAASLRADTTPAETAPATTSTATAHASQRLGAGASSLSASMSTVSPSAVRRGRSVAVSTCQGSSLTGISGIVRTHQRAVFDCLAGALISRPTLRLRRCGSAGSSATATVLAGECGHPSSDDPGLAGNPADADVDSVEGALSAPVVSSSFIGTLIPPAPGNISGAASEPANGYGPISGSSVPVAIPGC